MTPMAPFFPHSHPQLKMQTPLRCLPCSIQCEHNDVFDVFSVKPGLLTYCRRFAVINESFFFKRTLSSVFNSLVCHPNVRLTTRGTPSPHINLPQTTLQFSFHALKKWHPATVGDVWAVANHTWHWISEITCLKRVYKYPWAPQGC